MIRGSEIRFSYDGGRPALNNVTVSVGRGELIAILGRNGSGKSTLARLLNGLLPLQAGSLRVAGIDVRRTDEVWRLRRLCGMVFQDPDSQFVSSPLTDDVAFGLENYGVPETEIPERVAAALRRVGLEGLGARAPHTLSGGQKQRAALAAVLALEPDILVFDEATSMLDPEGRREVLTAMREQRRLGRTVVMITHCVEEAADADRVLLMRDGALLACGPPREILTDRARMQQAGLLPPTPVRLYWDLADRGLRLSRCPLTNEELADEICQLKP